MDYNEFLGQIASMFEAQTERIEQKVDQKLQEQNEKIDGLQEQTEDLRLYIENNVSRKIEALFDGYKLTHEKQWEQENKINNLENDVDMLKAEVYALKQKVS